ncbi:unnamed protein product [Clonostachys rosea f. rosea IK726]|uniref:Uncharacterized protein n=1 Tax=Clonostachys rosea f. rosea IK726 TaxID=1349383 RepID=A0ACA9TKX9_BIOOC|nr:unnamed protein product [Clonostachys rosea f. rosea IK726]
MPGVPRSRGCRTCKCDQYWPQCGACRRRGVTCPGPSTLLKFVPDGLHADHKPVLGTPIDQYGDGRETRQLQLQLQLPSRTPSPQFPSTTIADGIAARLVLHLNSAPDRGMIIQTKYLKHLPKRLSEFPCLCDVIYLFCSVWADFRRHMPLVEFVTMPAYGRAIKSLRQALESRNAFTVETLAAITILQRTEDLFNPGRRTMLHEKGITILLAAIGPPKPDDGFYTSLVCENYGILVPYWILTGWRNIMNDPPWGVAISNAMYDYPELKQMKAPLKSALFQLTGICARMPDLIRYRQSLWKPAESTTVLPNLENITQEFRRTDHEAGTITSGFLNKMFELGEATEEKDPTSVTGTSYHISNLHAAQGLIAFFGFRVCILRMRYDWSCAHGLPDAAALLKDLRALCVQVWNFIPYFCRYEAFVAVTSSQRGIILTYELATPEQKERLLDIYIDLDSYRKRLPEDRALVEMEIVSLARLWTGRMPLQ